MNNTITPVSDSPDIYQSGELLIETESGKVTLGEQSVLISGLTYRLLLAFIQSGNKILTSEELSQSVWSKSYVSDETIAQRVSLLRRALNDSEKGLIESVRGMGYRWIPPVKAVEHTNKTSLTDKYQDVMQSTKIPPVVLPLMIVILLLSLAFYIYSDIGAISTQPETEATPPQSLLLERADQYAQQYNKNANAIAIELFKEARNGDRADVKANHGLVESLLQRVSKYNGSPQLLETADSISKRLLSQNPSDWRANWLRGYYYDVLGNLNQAIRYYEKALSLNPQAQRVAGSLAYLYVRKGRLHEAMHLNIKAFSGNSRYKILQIAEILYLADLESQAKHWLETAYKLAPDDNFATVQWAKFHLAQGELNTASHLLAKLETQQSATQDSYILQSFIALEQQDTQSAQNYLDKAHQLRPQSPYVQPLIYWFEKNHLKNKTLAAPSLQLDENGWPNAFVMKSMIDIADGNFEQAVQTLNKAVELGFVDYRFLQNSPPFAALQSITGFQQVIETMVHNAHTERTKIEAFTLPKLNPLIPAG